MHPNDLHFHRCTFSLIILDYPEWNTVIQTWIARWWIWVLLEAALFPLVRQMVLISTLWPKGNTDFNLNIKHCYYADYNRYNRSNTACAYSGFNVPVFCCCSSFIIYTISAMIRQYLVPVTSTFTYFACSSSTTVMFTSLHNSLEHLKHI